MSDKETLEKENEQFSSAILYVATAVYVSVCAMVFGALYAKLPSFGEAFLTLMKDYGTILTGIPVLVAVVVAKQQLDANRRQHVATVKRGLRDEIEALDLAKALVRNILDANLESNDLFSRVLNKVDVPRPTTDHLRQLAGRIPNQIYRMLVTTSGDIDVFNQRTIETLEKRQNAEEALEELKDDAKYILADINAHYRYLSQYWS